MDRVRRDKWSGEETEHAKGVGFWLSKWARKALISYNPINSRIIAARFKRTPLDFTVIQVYAPTTSGSEEEIEIFYEQLEKISNEVPKKCEGNNRRLE